jgi:hypothetical protein
MEKYDGVIRELAALLVPHIAEKIKGELMAEIDNRVNERIDQLGQLDRAAIGDFVRAELENMEIVTSEDLNDRLEEKIKDADLSGPVREVIRHQLTFSVAVE